MEATTQEYYAVGGMQVDVNPFKMKDSECNLLLNFYSHRYLAKKVRYGYTPFLDNPDGMPVRNIIYYDLPGVGTGIVRVSGNNTYVNSTFTGSWGTNQKSWNYDKYIPNCQVYGSTAYLHMGNPVDGYFTFDGTTWKHWTGPFTPSPLLLTAWASRSFASSPNGVRLIESAVDFDFSADFATDPFSYDPNSADPSQGGSTSVDAGNNGPIVWMDVVQNAVNVYKQFGVYRWDGSTMLPLNFHDYIFGSTVCQSDMFKVDYFLSYNQIYMNDGKTVQPISFGINNILEDTFRKLGISNPVAFCFGHHAFFYIGDIQVRNEVIHNGMIVYDERYQEWEIWGLGHPITAFGQYVDGQGVRHMLTGDAAGNTYIWSEAFSSDAGVPIDYRLRTKYFDHGSPTSSKVPQPQAAISADPAEEAQIGMARDFSDDYHVIGSASGILSKFNTESAAYPTYKTNSIEISGSTTTSRPEFYGCALSLDEEERPDKTPNVISKGSR